MDGKKAVIIYLGILIIVVLAIVIGMQIFFHVYEPKESGLESFQIINQFITKYKIN